MSVKVPDEIASLLNKEVPERLWHYTTYEGLMGIMDVGSIHATDIRFLNDSEEFVHAKKLILKIAEETATKLVMARNRMGLEKAAKEALLNSASWFFDKGPLSEESLQVFVACFSERKDTLSQWRGYTTASSGLSMGFDLQEFREINKSQIIALAPCIYDEEEKRRYLSLILEGVFQDTIELQQLAWDAGSLTGFTDHTAESEAAFDQWYTNNPDVDKTCEKLNASMRDATYCLLQVAALMKHSSFSEEAEWRIVVPRVNGLNDEDHAVFFTPRLDTLVPRVKVGLPLGAQSMRELITGPNSHSCANAALTQMLSLQNLNASISSSIAPYRVKAS